ncbi:7191_t:CDS:2 [Funneliformis mosseae]|uniref:7191_t:CDS:1 n=1 Tax=Funneliformis mosseae TaxID=27381 RepID=A0A9N8YY47_FUNMO|nr:7191_t:CDS:2 [Funneliformis mosseae]
MITLNTSYNVGHASPNNFRVLISPFIEFDPVPLILIFAISLNLLGCVEVFYRVHCKKCRIGKNQPLPLDSKFSFNIAISNVLFAIMQIIDLILTGTSSIKPGIACDFMGIFSPSFLTFNLLSVTSFTYLLFLRVCKSVDITRKHDWRLRKLLFLGSWVASIYGLNRYEPQDLWCSNKPQGGIIYLVNVGFITSILIFALTICFRLVNMTLYGISDDHVRVNKKREPVQPHVIRNAVSSLIPYFVQWICVLIYNFALLHEVNDKSTKSFFTIILILGVNLGGFGNAFMYIINEYRTFLIVGNPTKCHTLDQNNVVVNSISRGICMDFL